MKPLIILICLLCLAPLAAKPYHDTDFAEAPYFKVSGHGTNVEAFPLYSTDVKAEISGVIAHVTVSQVYQNRGDTTIEGVYVFPGSTRSAVHGLEMKLGDRVVVAKVEEKVSARVQYEMARAAGKTASLLEQHRPNVFQMQVANIGPGEVVEVTLSYTEHLVPTERVYEFVYPTVVAPRYDGASIANEGWTTNPHVAPKEGMAPSLNMEVEISAGMPIHGIRCNTHDIDQNFISKDRAIVKVSNDQQRSGDRDFVLRYRLADRKIDAGLLLNKGQNGQENFFALTVQPPERIKPDEVLKREYVFVVDVSGSMNGYPLNLAKRLMTDLIGDLGKQDRFNIVAFASGQHLYSPVMKNGTDAEIKEAIKWMGSRNGNGGTEMLAALNKVFSLPGKETGVARAVIVSTDGMVSFDREAFTMVRENLGNANLFAFGVGSSTNRHLIEGIAVAGHGESFVATDSSRAALMAERFRNYVSSPLLTNIQLDFDGISTYDVIPESIPDVYADRPVTIYGKWKGDFSGQFTIKGQSGNKPVSITKSISPETVKNEVALPYLWARQKIRDLDDFEGRTVNPKTKAEVINLGLKYNLATRFTSFLAIDEKPVEHQFTSASSHKVVQKSPMPQGMSGGSTPGPALIPLLLAGLAGLFGKKFLRKS